MLFKICYSVFISAICVSRERYFRNNGWTCSKVEKREQGLQLGNSQITHPVEHFDQKIVFARFAHIKKFMARERTVVQLRLGQI